MVDADHVLVVADGDVQLGLVGAVGELVETLEVGGGGFPAVVVAGDRAAAGDVPDHILEFRILGPFKVADEGRRLVEDFWGGKAQKGAVLAMALTRAAEAAVLAGEPRRAAGILVELLGVLADLGTRR